jgi:hypothetical protein
LRDSPEAAWNSGRARPVPATGAVAETATGAVAAR